MKKLFLFCFVVFGGFVLAFSTVYPQEGEWLTVKSDGVVWAIQADNGSAYIGGANSLFQRIRRDGRVLKDWNNNWIFSIRDNLVGTISNNKLLELEGNIIKRVLVRIPEEYRTKRWICSSAIRLPEGGWVASIGKWLWFSDGSRYDYDNSGGVIPAPTTYSAAYTPFPGDNTILGYEISILKLTGWQNLIFGAHKTGVIIFDTQTKEFSEISYFKGEDIRAVSVVGNRLYIGRFPRGLFVNSGVFVYDITAESVVDSLVASTSNNFSYPSDIILLQDGRLLIIQAGIPIVQIIEPSDLTILGELTPQNSGLRAQATVMDQGPDGTVWFGTTKGVYIWRPASEGPFIPFRPKVSVNQELRGTELHLDVQVSQIDPLTTHLDWEFAHNTGEVIDEQRISVSGTDSLGLALTFEVEPGEHYTFSARGVRVLDFGTSTSDWIATQITAANPPPAPKIKLSNQKIYQVSELAELADVELRVNVEENVSTLFIKETDNLARETTSYSLDLTQETGSVIPSPTGGESVAGYQVKWQVVDSTTVNISLLGLPFWTDEKGNNLLDHTLEMTAVNIWGLSSEPATFELKLKGTQAIPQKFTLYQNYPNPFNPGTTIKYDLPEDSPVKLVIYNLLGQKVRVLVNEQKPAGSYEVPWDGTDEFGRRVSSGVYIYRLKAGDFTETKKMVLVK